jgi:ABC-type branched-chain amino acid transport systems, ATPase component
VKDVLKVQNASVQFGGLKAVENVSFEIKEGELLGLIGPNGAGKTTIFNLVTGVYAPSAGHIFLNDEEITGKKQEQIVKSGMARTFQNIRLFKKMTVLENVKVACNHHMSYSVVQAVTRGKKYRSEEQEAQELAESILDIFSMGHLQESLAVNLPYGQQRKLEIARAMATNPSVLLLDEPAAGMNPTETAELMETIALIRDRYNISILLIEHDMSLVMGICERIVVLNYGTVLASGTPSEVANNPQVIAAYLGE